PFCLVFLPPICRGLATAIVHTFVYVVPFFLGQQEIFGIFGTYQFVVILVMNPSKFGNFMSVATYQNIVIATGSIFTTGQGSRGSVFPIAFPIYVYPTGRAFISGAVIYLVHFLCPLSLHFLFRFLYVIPLVIPLVYIQILVAI